MTTIKIETEGLSLLLRQLQSVGVDGSNALRVTVQNLAIDTHRKAVEGIQRGAKTGITYVKKNPSRVHQASAPGQYPASDTGRLASSVAMVPESGPNGVTFLVGTNLIYGPHLEFGTSKMAARPWLFPSFEKAKRNTAAKLKAEFDRRVAQ